LYSEDVCYELRENCGVYKEWTKYEWGQREKESLTMSTSYGLGVQPLMKMMTMMINALVYWMSYVK
jgi:dTDP-4-dehydrorhamnose 3,5-epimerase-like enzyme